MKKLLAILFTFVFNIFSFPFIFAEDKIDIMELELLSNDIIIIFDSRDKKVALDQIIKQVKTIDSLKNSNIYKYDFSDHKIKEYLQKNNIKYLPAILFNNNNIDPNIDKFLYKLPNSKYSLIIWARFDPFEKRSDRGFKVLDESKLKKVKENSYINWNKNAQITWIEYSDLECPFCARLHNNWTPKDIKNKYPNSVNIILNHFPLSFHKNAFTASQILECSSKQKWSDIFYNLIEISFENQNSTKKFMIKESVKLWVNKEKLENCIKSWKYDEKIKNQMSYWSKIFWITWTPWNVIINNKTWEYEVISWAYPTEIFIKTIDSLLVDKIKIINKKRDHNILIIREKHKNNKKLIDVFNKVDNLFLKLNNNQAYYLYKKVNKIKAKLKHKKDKKSLLMKDIINYINNVYIENFIP